MKIVGLGDSNTWGFPYGPDYSWLHALGMKLSCEVLNHGINGECLSDMRARIPQVLAAQPELVIVMGGTNDAFEGLSLHQVNNELTAIVDELTAKTASTILVGLPIPTDYQAEELLLQQYRAWMRSFATERGIAVIDFYSCLLDPQTGGIFAKYNMDGVHPNGEGFKRMAEEAYRVVSELTGS